MLAPVDDPRETSVEGTEARGAAEVADVRAFADTAVFVFGAVSTALVVLDAGFFETAFFKPAIGRTLVARAGVRVRGFGAPVFFLVAAFFGVAAAAVFFKGAAAFRAVDRVPAVVRRPVTGFLVAAVFRAAAFFAGEAFVVAFRAAGFVAAAFRTGTETCFAPRAVVRAFFFDFAIFRVATPARRVDALRVPAAARAAGRADVRRADVPDLRGAGFLAIWGSSELP